MNIFKEKKVKSKQTKQLTNDPSKCPNGNELDLIDKLKQIDSERMYLSSSSNDCLETSGHQLSDAANHEDAHHDQHQSSSQATNSLTSSSSSSCSLFEGTTNPSSSQSNAEHLSDVNKEEGNIIDETLNKTPDVAPAKFQSFFKLNETNRFASDIESALHNLHSGYSASPAGLKKPITFASIAAAAAHSGTPTALTLNTNVSPGFQAKFGSPSNSKIESILNEFKQNIYLLQLALNQVILFKWHNFFTIFPFKKIFQISFII